MKLVRHSLIAVALIVGTSGASVAQNTRYDANCNVTENTQESTDADDIAKMHPILSLGFKLGQKTCKGVNFIKSIFRSEPDPDKIDVNDAMEASKSTIAHASERQMPDAATAEQWKLTLERKAWEKRHPMWAARQAAAERNRTTNAADEAVAAANAREKAGGDWGLLPPDRPGGFIKIFQANAANAPVPTDGAVLKPADIDGEGAVISEDGIERGTFKDGALEGAGEEITDEGTWRGGSYQGGEIDGQGFELGERNGQPYLMEGNFDNDAPNGIVTMTYPDGTSQRVAWEGGRAVAYGRLATAGNAPAEPDYKTPAQLAEEADRAFDASLASAPSAGALYALADELKESGDDAKARRVYRALMKRFPTSPFATKAADQLDGSGTPLTGAAPNTPARAPASADNSSTTLDGNWIGDKGNRVTLARVSGGYNNVGTGASGTFFFREVDAKTFRYTFPDGQQTTMVIVGPQLLRVTNSDGWTDLFRRETTQKPVSTAANGCAAGINGMAALNSAMNNFTARYPVQQGGGMRDSYQYKIFLGTEGLKILGPLKSCLSPADYEANRAALQGAIDDGRTNCPKVSSDGGANCIAEYPRNWR